MNRVAYFQNLLNLSPAARYFFSLVVVLLCLNGCVISTEPLQSADFEGTAKVEQLVGVYKNKGDSGPDVVEGIFLSEIIGPAKNSELENEIQNYIAIFNGDDMYIKKRAMSGLVWSGIADARLFDILEAELLNYYQAETWTIVEKLPYLVKALGK